jgi:glycosyltransferase involved in cell wall biosynthesis
MRVLYFADIRFPLERANGIQTMETCFALAQRGHTVHLVVKADTQSPARDPFEFYGLPKQVSLIIERANAPAGAGVLARVGYLSFAFGRAFGKSRAQIVMTRDLGVASALLRLPPAMRPRLVYESHGHAADVSAALPDMIATAQRATPAKLERLARREAVVWKQADGYVTITRALAEELTKRLGARARLAIVPDGVRQPKTQPSAIPAERVVAYAGHLYAWKGVDVLLHALALLPEASGLIIGGHSAEPDLARVRQLAQQLGIRDRVTFTGIVDPARVAEQLAGARVLVLPNPESAISTRFTSPLKMFEYMAAGRAIVASDLPSIREVLADGRNALLVKPGDQAALAAGIRTLINDRELAQRLARAAFEDVAQYTWERRAQRLEALFEQAASA